MRLLIAFTAFVLTASAGGCTTRQEPPPGSTGEPGTRLKVSVIAGPLFDPFFGALKSGAEAAAKDLGAEVGYLAPGDGADLGAQLTRLMRTAVTDRADAIVVGDYFPDLQDPEIRKTVDGGMTVVVVNSGEPSWEKVGATTYVGQDERQTGELAGRRMAEAGARRVVCVNHVPGSPIMQQRCDGLREALKARSGTATDVVLTSADATNPTAVQQAIAGALAADSAVDGVFTLGSSFAEQALRAVEQNGRTAGVRVATTDLSTGVLEAVRDGKILFALDQQPYLQGYYGVLTAVQKIKYGLRPIGPVRTGPLVVDRENAASVLEHNQHGGVRGAK